VYRKWSPVSRWSKSAVRQLSLVSQTEDYEYNKVVVGDSTDPNLIWFVLNVSLCRGITTSVDWFALPRGLPPPPLGDIMGPWYVGALVYLTYLT